MDKLTTAYAELYVADAAQSAAWFRDTYGFAILAPAAVSTSSRRALSQ
jgi:hypothetical protein